MLLMSATPIPRSLVLALYGDLDISALLHKPAGRQPIKTIVKPQDQWGDVALALRRTIEAGDQAYWICPLVEETEVTKLTAAEDRHAMLQEMFGPRVGLVHGRMKGEEKDAVMRRFKAHELDILVATTVVEVGVDVPNATVMVIEHAERFGLAQLHQLRGRIGRGTKASTCLLLYTAPLGETARSRLSIMRESNDGFVIAEEDLRLRGAGDVMGTRQSGLPDMNFATLPEHNDLLEIAQRDAQLTLNKMPILPDRAARRFGPCSIFSNASRRLRFWKLADATAASRGAKPSAAGDGLRPDRTGSGSLRHRRGLNTSRRSSGYHPVNLPLDQRNGLATDFSRPRNGNGLVCLQLISVDAVAFAHVPRLLTTEIHNCHAIKQLMPFGIVEHR